MIQIIPVKKHYVTNFYIYRGDTLVRICPSIGMALKVAAAYR
jgi:hypothetical protein